MLIDAAFLQSCANQMHPAISYAIVRAESNFKPFAIGVNRSAQLKNQPANLSQAVAAAKGLIAAGKNIDLGLAQINSSNLNWLGMSVEQAFEPCSNLKAMQRIYLDCLAKAGSAGQGTPMQRAWSCYNTGNHRRGFANGYVAKVTGHYNAVFNYSNNQKIQHQADIIKNAIGTPKIVSSASVLPNYQNQKINEYDANDSEIKGVLMASDEQYNELAKKSHESWDIFQELSN